VLCQTLEQKTIARLIWSMDWQPVSGGDDPCRANAIQYVKMFADHRWIVYQMAV
jgi:hypothetical protein